MSNKLNDLIVLRSMLTFGVFLKYGKIFGKLKSLESEHKRLLKTIEQYYDEYPGTEKISINEIESYFSQQNPMVSGAFGDLFDKLNKLDVKNDELIDRILQQVVEKQACSRISEVAMAVINNQATEGVETITSEIDNYREIVGQIAGTDEDALDMSIDNILSDMDREGPQWSLRLLNDKLGPIRTRTLGHILARPDSGKTSLIVHQTAYWATMCEYKGIKGKFLYMNNEEDIKIVAQRFLCSANDADIGWIKQNKQKAEEVFKEKTGDRIILVGNVSHIRDVERHIRRYRPLVAVMDQGPKVFFPGNMDEISKKQKLFNRYREIAKEYDCSFISLGQADNASEGKPFLGLSNLDGSKVGIPGELDWCVGIGRKNEGGLENVRYLNIAKNKLTGLIGRDQVNINPQTCRFGDITK